MSTNWKWATFTLWVAALSVIGLAQVTRLRTTTRITRDSAAQLAKLESRLLEVDSRYDQIKSVVTNILAAEHDNTVTVETLSKDLSENLKEMFVSLKSFTNDIARQMKGMTTVRPVTIRSVQARVDSKTAGVPTEVYNSIAATAAGRWSNDYEMQVFEIKSQIEAYRQLHQ